MAMRHIDPVSCSLKVWVSFSPLIGADMYAATSMREEKKLISSNQTKLAMTISSLQLTVNTGKSLLVTRYVLLIFLFYSLFKHTTQMFLPLNSQYYLAIAIYIVYFGLVTAGVRLLKIILAGQNRRLVERHAT